MRYQILRSVRDKKIHVICSEGSFANLPDDIRKLGPWQSLKRGDLDRLKTTTACSSPSRVSSSSTNPWAPSPPTMPKRQSVGGLLSDVAHLLKSEPEARDGFHGGSSIIGPMREEQ